jgi:hypothetical protein
VLVEVARACAAGGTVICLAMAGCGMGPTFVWLK